MNGDFGGAEGVGVRIATASVYTGFAMTHYKECVGEGLCPSRGRPQGSPLRRVTRGAVGGPSGTPAPTKVYLVVRRGGALPLPRTTARVAPTKGLQGVRCAGRRGRRPLRKGCMGCGRRATARVAPTEGYKGCGTKSAGGVEPRPYEGLQGVTACGGGLLRCIRGAFCSARRYYGPPGPRFGPGRDRR